MLSGVSALVLWTRHISVGVCLSRTVGPCGLDMPCWRSIALQAGVTEVKQECPVEATVNIEAMAAWTTLVGRSARGFPLAFLGSVASGAEQPLRVAVQQAFATVLVQADSGLEDIASAPEYAPDIFMDSVN